MTRLGILSTITLCMLLAACNSCKQTQTVAKTETKVENISKDTMTEIVKTEEEWLKELGPEAYRVLRQKGTERPHTGEYDQYWEAGTYVCRACGYELFTSDTKFDAGCGWPSFYKSVDKSHVREIRDSSHGMIRTEVVCARCGGHLGHVFDDAPDQPTGMRYCINSLSLGFKKKE